MTVLAVPCKGHQGCVDLIDGRYAEDSPDGDGGDVLHMTAAEWAEFVAAVKAGQYDDVQEHHKPQENLS